MESEASRITGVIVSLVAAVIALVVAFGVPLTPDQRTAILSACAVVAPLIAMAIIRSHVYSQKTTERLVAQAIEMPTQTPAEAAFKAKQMVEAAK